MKPVEKQITIVIVEDFKLIDGYDKENKVKVLRFKPNK